MDPQHRPGESASDAATVGPVAPSRREPILDMLRGFAMLGILLVNVEYMRGADFYRLMSGEALPPAQGADRVVEFGVGWLATGKFVSSFAIMFGLGVALMAERAQQAGHAPVGVLGRRYAVLLLLGIAHMVLLFPGDILFVYGIAGLVLLAFVGVEARSALWWSGGLTAFVVVSSLGLASLTLTMPEPDPDDPVTADMTAFVEERRDAALAAHTEGNYADIVAVNAWESLLVQFGQLFTLPWILALFLVGFAVGRAGVLADVRAHRSMLRRAAVVGLGLGLPLNLVLGTLGPMATGKIFTPGAASPEVVLLGAVALTLGAPLLAVGYLSVLALWSLRFGPVRPLAAIGRMALTAYLLQSLLAVVVFGGFRLYDQLSTTGALLVVAGIWLVLFLVCPLWMRWFRFGPVEWAWRAATYGRRPPMRTAQ